MPCFCSLCAQAPGTVVCWVSERMFDYKEAEVDICTGFAQAFKRPYVWYNKVRSFTKKLKYIFFAGFAQAPREAL
jgi:hypothetical protein